MNLDDKLKTADQAETLPDIDFSCSQLGSEKRISLAYSDEYEFGIRHDTPELPYEFFESFTDGALILIDGRAIPFLSARVASRGTSFSVIYFGLDSAAFQRGLESAGEHSDFAVKDPENLSTSRYVVGNLREKWSDFLERCDP